jgi:thiol-disulfide isomerase/thioredoxin
MKINIIILFLILSFSAFCAYVFYNQTPKQKANHEFLKEKNFQPAPNFEYQTISGHTGSLKNHTGKVILLHFWASWCAPCLIEFPEIIELAKKDTQNLIILAVSSDKNIADIQKFQERNNLDIPSNLLLIHDGDKIITQELYSTFKLPETYLISPELEIYKKYIGPQTGRIEQFWEKNIYPLIKNETNY